MKKEDFQFHHVTTEENQRLQNSPYEKYKGQDIHGEGGDFVGSFNKIKDQTVGIGNYIIMLENKLIELNQENHQLKKELNTIKHNQDLTIKWARGEIDN